jgi:hypothetical protein
MVWLGTLGLALLVASVGILMVLFLGWWRERRRQQSDTTYERGSLEARLQDDIRRRQMRL